MTVECFTLFDIDDITALKVVCPRCGVEITLPLDRETTVLDSEMVYTCGVTLWQGGADTALGRAMIKARVERQRLFRFVARRSDGRDAGEAGDGGS